jgi:valine--pyruvate aminotransferase
MALNLSVFGQRFTRSTGALQLMDDLGNALAGESPQLMLGGGNPGRIPTIQQWLRQRLAEVGANERQFDRMLANYAHPRGELGFRRSLARLLGQTYGWPLTEAHVALTAGSQAAFLMLFNLFGGERADGSSRRILLPVTPEYVGYADVGISDGLLTARRPAIELLDEPFFKYHLDVANLRMGDDIAAVCVSRPTNPTGNVLADDEIASLDRLCRSADVPLIVDGAYGPPFPNIMFVDATPIWNDNVIYCMSLSKLGLPGARTGIVVARPEIIDALASMTAVFNLAVGSVGPVLVQPALEDGSILALCNDHVTPFYRAKALRCCEWLARELSGVQYRIHRPEGAFFLWLWLPGLPIPSDVLYERLKSAGLFVLSGHHFFPGLADEWVHRHECLRISFAQDEAIVEAGIRTLGAEVRKLYR